MKITLEGVLFCVSILMLIGMVTGVLLLLG
jgi:hypothetical protein